jgi:hypothetical protein
MFGTVLSGRDFEGADEVMFPAMNTVPVRVILHGTFAELLGWMQDASARALKHQMTGLGEVQKAVAGGRRLFDTLFVYQRSSAGLGMGGEGDNERLWESVGGESDVEVCFDTLKVWRYTDRLSTISALN